MAKSIPTIGRRIWYWPETLEDDTAEGVCIDDNQPYDAGIIFVYSDGHVNLGVTDHEGNYFPKQDVVISDEEIPGCAQWMPYQEKKAAEEAAKAEAAKADPNWP
jgi:hypothetical protein